MHRCDSNFPQPCILLHFVALERAADSLLPVLVRWLGVVTSKMTRIPSSWIWIRSHPPVAELCGAHPGRRIYCERAAATWQLTCEGPIICERLR